MLLVRAGRACDVVRATQAGAGDVTRTVGAVFTAATAGAQRMPTPAGAHHGDSSLFLVVPIGPGGVRLTANFRAGRLSV